MLPKKNTVSKVIDIVFTAIVFMIAAIVLVAAILIFIITNMAGLGFIIGCWL